MQVVGRVERLHRYPVKSLRGESPDEVEVDRALSPGAALDDALTGHVGRPVRLAEEEDVAHHDDSPVHLVTDASSRSVGADPACFRANLVVSALGAAGFVEDVWVGRDLAVGAVRLRVTGTTERCVMVGAATLRTVSARNALRLGVYADVLETGVVRAGDDVVLD